MTRILSIDPGAEYYAYAEWYDGRLKGAGLLGIDTPFALIGFPVVVIEKPRVYDRSARDKAAAKGGSVVDLAIAVGRLVERAPYAVELVLPETWKGQTPKRVHHPRILASLTSGERSLLEGMRKKDLGHVLDAIGIGLYHLNKTGARPADKGE